MKVLGDSPGDDQDEKLVFVLTSRCLQKWLLVKDDEENLLYNCNVTAMAKEAFARTVWVSSKS